MKRLVYSPKVYAFVKADSGIIDLSPFITDCSVNRQVNAVSSASITFRNPGRKFTNGKNGPTFHPMDPIVIFMKRLHNRPVQVFTGYCDTTPYYQLRPGQATISASCTLKRLLHTYWDPGLPFVSRVLSQRGWAMYNGSLGNVAAGISNGGNNNDDNNDNNDDNNRDDRNQDVVPATDGSIGALLYDVLLYIGNWHPDTIYIENLPEDLYEGAEALLGDINEANKEAQRQWKQLMKQIIGDGGTYGGGDPGTVNDTGQFGSLGGVQGTGFSQEELAQVRSHPNAGSNVSAGTHESTAYGPPWDSMQGTGVTSTGISLQGGVKKYLVAVDPYTNNYGTLLYIWPNPYRWTGPFVAADTGGAFLGQGKKVDFYMWEGGDARYDWGRKDVQVSKNPIKEANVPNSSGAGQGGRTG